MTIKIDEFKGTATVLGMTRIVQLAPTYVDGKEVFHLLITPMNMAETQELLSRIGPALAGDFAATLTVVPDSKPAKPKKATEPPKEATKAEPEPEPDPEPAKPETKADAPAEEAPKVEAAKPAKAKKADKETGVTPMEMPDKIKKVATMRELLVWMLESGGVKTAAEMIAQCVALQKEIPLLTKVPQVAERVERAITALGLFPAAEEQQAAG